MTADPVLAEQLAYYRARAQEYDRWWLRQGRFDRGAEADARWFAEAAELERLLAEFNPGGDVLELACGTGLWTRHLVTYAAHVPQDRFAAFWERVAGALKPGGRVFFIDSARTQRSTAADHRLPDEGQATMTRRLEDGREFQIIKRFYDPATLTADLGQLGWDCRIGTTGEFFIYGQGSPGT